jgi:NAD(P)-dependent dehydrogenase (short-subunit alcohol dehydrogenase family)
MASVAESAPGSALEFKGKVVVVTGGSQGIGETIAQQFAKLGATVVICSRTKDELENAAARIRSAHGICSTFPLDVVDASEVEIFFSHIEEKHQRIDILVNCAGISGPVGMFEMNDRGAWRKTIDINLVGTMNCTHAALPGMKRRRFGRIINMAGGGVGGPRLHQGLSAYITSKFAVCGFTEAVANELAGSGVTINAIAPGAVNTKLFKEMMAGVDSVDEKTRASLRGQYESGGTPPEVGAKLVLFLACDASAFISGKTLSAMRDDYTHFTPESLDASLYTLRRIDNVLYSEKNDLKE